jgi:hypothetical protein
MTEIEQSVRCCPRTCDGPDVVIPGVSGAAGAAGGVGLTGLDGRVPIIRTTEPFIVPLYGDTVTVAVDDTDFLPIFPRTIRFEIAIGAVTFYLLSFTKTTITITPTTADNALLEICKGKPASTPVPVAPRAYRVAWGVPGDPVIFQSSVDQANPSFILGGYLLLDTFSSQFRTTINKFGGYQYSLYYDATLQQKLSAGAIGIGQFFTCTDQTCLGTPHNRTTYLNSWGTFNVSPGQYFDGVLVGIGLELQATNRTTFRLENLEPTPQTINASSTITVAASTSGNALFTTAPVASISNSVTAFDGTIDFGGSTGNYGSGFSAPPVSGVNTENRTITSSDPLWSIFSGTGVVSVDATASGVDTTACVPGPTNLARATAYEFGIGITARYKYHPFTGYFWFMYDVQATFSPHSFKVASTGEDLPMASADDFLVFIPADYVFTVNGFGCTVYPDFSTNTTYRIFRSKYPFYGGDGPGAVIVT